MKVEFTALVESIGEENGQAQAPVVRLTPHLHSHLYIPILLQLGVVPITAGLSGISPERGREEAREWAQHLYGKVRITIETVSDAVVPR